MECAMPCKYSWLDFLFTVVGVGTFLFDLGADLWVARDFYLQGDYCWFGLVVGFIVVSSVLMQTFSWFWFKYDRELDAQTAQTATESLLLGGGRRWGLRALHICQLGFLLRYITAIEQGFLVWWKGKRGSDYAVYLTHDISMLRLFETFFESTPQLILMLYIIMHDNEARVVQWVSVAASTMSIAWMVLEYHRSLRSFLPEKAKLGYGSSVVYFLWNLLLIAPRVGAVALFTSVLPPFITLHFLLLWAAMFFWVWRQNTDFMDSVAGEGLYRATVALIWYFSWFNVAEGRTRGRSIIYHTIMVVDSAILVVTWWFYRDPALTQSYALPLLIVLPSSYLLGLLLKVLYYCCFHPKQWQRPEEAGEDVPDNDILFKSLSFGTAPSQMRNKRMVSLASNFYYRDAPQAPAANMNGNNGAI